MLFKIYMAFFFQMNKKGEIHSLSMQLQCMGTEFQKLHKHIIKVMQKKSLCSVMLVLYMYYYSFRFFFFSFSFYLFLLR